MKLYFKGLALIAVLFSIKANAQSAKDSVESTIRALFDGMINADSSKVAACFAQDAIQQTIVIDKAGKESVKTEPVFQFFLSVARLAKGDADERIQIVSLQVDGGLASVWTPYKFYYKGKFSHCGANSFQLVRTQTGWKIQYLIDSRRRQGCE